MIKRLTKREQIIAGVTFLAAVVCLGFYGVYKPLLNELELIEDKISNNMKKYDNNLEMIHQAEGLEKQYQTSIEKYKQPGQNEQVMSALISEIEKVAGELNLPISDLKPNRVRKEAHYNQFSVSLTMDSKFVEAVNFLYILQNEPHLFDVEELRFDKGNRKDEPTVKTQLVLSKIFIP